MLIQFKFGRVRWLAANDRKKTKGVQNNLLFKTVHEAKTVEVRRTGQLRVSCLANCQLALSIEHLQVLTSVSH